MPPPRISSGLLAQLRSLSLSTHSRPSIFLPTITATSPCSSRPFSSTPHTSDWLLPRTRAARKTHKGRVQVNTGGSTRGTTVQWGNYGLRLVSHDQRIPSKQLGIGEAVIKQRLRGMTYVLYKRVSAGLGVYTSGNDQRMGKGKGSFDHWAARVATGRVVFEIKGDVHEQVVRDAMRLAGNKLPGSWEFITKDAAPVMGTTKMENGITAEDLWRPRRKEPLHPLHKLPDGTRAGDLTPVSAPAVPSGQAGGAVSAGSTTSTSL